MVDDVDIFEPGLEVTVPLPANKGDETFLRGVSSIYNFLAPSDERQAELDQIAADREDVLERLGIDKAQATGMLGFGDERGQLLEDMGFQPRTIKEDFDRFREFMYGAQQSGFQKRTAGVAHEDLTMEEKIGSFMLPIDVLDVVGLGFGVKQLIKLGIKKFGQGSNKSVIDLANDQSIVNQMSDAEARDLAKDLQPVLGGEQNVFLRYAKKPKQKKKRAAPDLKQAAEVQTATPPPSLIEKTEPEVLARDPIPEIPEVSDELFFGKTVDAPTLKPKADAPKVDKRTLSLDVGEYKKPLLNLRRSIELAPDSEATVKLFVDNVQKGLGNQPTKVQKQIKKSIGEDQYNKLMDQAIEMGLLKGRVNIGPAGKILTPDGEDFIKENYTSMTRDEILSALRADKTKYFYTDLAGNFKDLKDRGFATLAYSLGLSGAKKSPQPIRMKIDEIMEQFEKKLNEIEKTGTPITEKIRKQEFEFAVRKAEGLENQPFTDIQTIINNRRLKYNELNPDNPILTQRELFQMSGDGKPGRKEFTRKFYSFFKESDEKKQALENLGVTLGQDKNKNAATLDRFFDFIRESTPEYKAVNLADEKSLEEFITSMGPRIDELADKNSIFRKNYDYFKVVDDTREEMGELVKPFLNRLFAAPEFKTITKKDGTKINVKRTEKELIEDAKRSLQIAHRYEGKQIGQTLPKDLAGASEFPQSYTIDVSFINQAVQPSLEGYARKAVRDMKKGKIDEDELRIINDTAERLGTAFEVDGIQFGTQKGIADKLEQYLQYILRRPDKQKEFGITKEMILNVRKAIDIARQKNMEGYNFSRGGMVEDDTINIFEDDMPEGSFEVASLKLPFFKMFGKPPINEVAPIPVPKEKLTNPTKKQTQSLEGEREKIQEVFDPTPDEKIDLAGETIEVTPYTKQPMTSIFYSDVERVLARPDTPETFANKQAVIDFFNKNRIKKTELEDYRIGPLLKLFEDNAPIPKAQIIRQVRQAPIKGLKLHATGPGSELINPGREVPVRYSGYAEDGFVGGSQRERVLYINKKDLPGDPGEYPTGMFGGESVPRHEFQIPSEDDTYIVGWSRLTDRMGILPTRLEAPKTKSKIPGLTRERERAQRQVAGLYAEAINKLTREGARRGFSQTELDEISQLSLDEIMVEYGNTLAELSPGLLDQMDELIVKVRDLDTEIAKGSTADTSGIVKVAFVDEMQSDIMQKATERKQQLASALRKIQEEGEGTTIQGLNRQARQVIDFFEKNRTVFRPLQKTEEEATKIGEKIRKLDERVDEIVRGYIDTREISQANINELQTLLNDNINSLLNEIIEIDSSTVDKLFPDLPFKNRDEWADAIVKSNLYELAYKKFVLKEANAPEYYAITPSKLVSKRYNFVGDTATPAADRAADKARRIQEFKDSGSFTASKFKGIGMAEFYGGPKAVDESGKHYTSTLEKILKKQAKENNSEMVTMPVQLRSGGKDVFIVKDQNGNMVATLTNQEQATRLSQSNPNYRIETMRVPDEKSTTPVFAIKITKEMLEPYKTHKAMGGLVQIEDIFEV